MVTVEILAIGNELLIGDVLDTNTHWMIKQITGMGGRVIRCAMLPDNLDEIATEIQAALDRKTEVIFTIGGMGPTVDDLTLAAIAQGINQPLQLHPEAIAFVTQKYQEFAAKGYVDDAKMTPAREKMGILPQSSIPLRNPVGTAPAVISKVKETIIISLPGVPGELKGIFQESLLPIFQEKFGNNFYLERLAIVAIQDESVLAPILNIVSKNNPKVYIKSRAKTFEIDGKFKVTFSYCSSFNQEVVAAINQAIEDLRQELDNAGISIDYIE